MRLLLFLALISSSVTVYANRLIEVEDYYSAKASDFLKSRYPRQAFSVYVKVDADEQPEARQPASFDNRKGIALPFLDMVAEREVNFWDRKDISLGTLISYLKSVYIKVDIDGDFTQNESEQLKSELFQHLKLSEVYDRMEISPKKWESGFSLQKYRSQIFLVLTFLASFFAFFFLIFHSSVRSLIRGLAQPLSEIGRSAENVAKSSSLTTDLGLNTSLMPRTFQTDFLTSLEKEDFKNTLNQITPFLSQPTPVTLLTIEKLGAQDPSAMGALLVEMDIASLKSLMKYAKGSWWRQALTQPDQLSQTSQNFLIELNRLRLRDDLSQQKVQLPSEVKELTLMMTRMSIKQFGTAFEGLNFDQAKPYLSQLPRELMIPVAKYLYPGGWAELLEAENKTYDYKPTLLNPLKQKVEKLAPLSTDQQISDYFKEAELIKILDQSSTKDERDVYKALSNQSWIKIHRTPFYSLFEQNDATLGTLASDLPLETWAYVIYCFDRKECDQIYSFFSARQKVLLRDYKASFEQQPPNPEKIALAKGQILRALKRLQTTALNEEVHGTQASA